jgi:hypothetical protein
VDEDAWRQLLAGLDLVGELHPVAVETLDAYERRSGFKLPASYRHFCRVFGPGSITDWFEIAVPDFKGRSPNRHDLDTVGRNSHDHLEWQAYSDDPQQYERAVIFGSDCTGARFFWDPAERTGRRGDECAVYAVWRDWTRGRVCDTFWEFASICLHRGSRTLYDDPPDLVFRAAWYGGRVQKRRKAEPRAAADRGPVLPHRPEQPGH